jgi:signal transduction histidine kinase
MSRRRTWTVGALLAVLTAAALVVQSATVVNGEWWDAGELLVQVVFAVVAGLLWVDREHRATAALVALAGISVGTGGLNTDLYWSLGGYWGELGWLSTYYVIPLILMVLLRYPIPVPEFPGRRLLIAGVWLVYLARIPASLFWDPRQTGYAGPGRWFTLFPDNAVCDLIVNVASGLLIGLCVWFVVIQVRRWRTAAGALRRAVRVTAGAAILLAGVLVVRLLVSIAIVSGWVDPRLDSPLSEVHILTAAATAIVLLVVALRQAVHRSDVVERMLTAAGDPRAVELELRRELADPSLLVSYRFGDEWLDADGRPISGHDPDTSRIVRGLARRDDEPTVRIDADASAGLDPARLRLTLAAAELALDNTRLTVERTAHLAELAASQARIVEAGVAQRRQLERDLHDGAQQSLLGVAATLSRAGLAEDPSVMRAVVDDARAQLSSALAELRQLARGIHPAALTQGGLRAGLLSLASRTARVELSFGPGLDNDVRFPTAVESTAYFVVAEAVTNALKYGGSGPIKVEVEHSADGLIVAVADDGPGDARIVAGGGLAGLLDRVRALGGALDLHTRSSGGIRVEARLPLTEAVA